MTYPVRVQRAPDEGLVYLHFGDANNLPMQTRSFPLLEDDHFQVRDIYEGIELAKILDTSAIVKDGQAKVSLPWDHHDSRRY